MPMHEQNGFKFGGISFETSDGSVIKEYRLSKDILSETDYSLDQDFNETKISEQTYPSFNPDNNTKFSTLSGGLIQVLSQIPAQRNTPPVNHSVALPSSGTDSTV